MSAGDPKQIALRHHAENHDQPIERQIIDWKPRLAKEADVAALETLIQLSVHALQAAHYSLAERNAALGPVFGVDRQLIRDNTYYVVEKDGAVVGCGGWSKRPSLFGADTGRTEEKMLEPPRDAARVRAFFVHPDWSRRGIGRSLLMTCEAAIRDAGFRRIELVATLAGEPLYAALGYAVAERYEVPLKDAVRLPVVRMTKQLL